MTTEERIQRTASRMRKLSAAALAIGLMGLSGAAAAADGERGKVLYETRCSACHEVSVHNRSARKARTFDGVRAQVQRWSGEVGGTWSRDDVDDVTLYLNQRFYRFKCPSSMCLPNQASLAH